MDDSNDTLKEVVHELLKAVNFVEKTRSMAEANNMLYDIFMLLTSEVVYRSLSSTTGKDYLTNTQAYEETSINFAMTKDLVAKAIADAFTTGVYRFTGQPLSYHVMIKAIDDRMKKNLN